MATATKKRKHSGEGRTKIDPTQKYRDLITFWHNAPSRKEAQRLFTEKYPDLDFDAQCTLCRNLEVFKKKGWNPLPRFKTAEPQRKRIDQGGVLSALIAVFGSEENAREMIANYGVPASQLGFDPKATSQAPPQNAQQLAAAG